MRTIIVVNWGTAEIRAFQTPKAAATFLKERNLTRCRGGVWATHEEDIEQGDYWSITEAVVEEGD
jgi:hypothetical protein